MEEKIPEFRQKVQELTLQGFRRDKVRELVENEYAICGRKAEFLSKQETGLLVSKYQASRLQEAGCTKFEWRTMGDSFVRDMHKELNGKLFSYSDLPVIDNKGNRGLPGEAFGCRCQQVPVSPR
jgi:SPP1 gp7 family putative phage head morphogenesis protein